MRLLMLMSVVLFAASAAAAPPADKPAKPATTKKTPTKVAGIRTVFVPSPSSPLCAIRLFFQVGAVDDPKGKEGLAILTSEMMGKGGSKARTYAELLDALYPL